MDIFYRYGSPVISLWDPQKKTDCSRKHIHLNVYKWKLDCSLK